MVFNILLASFCELCCALSDEVMEELGSGIGPKTRQQLIKQAMLHWRFVSALVQEDELLDPTRELESTEMRSLTKGIWNRSHHQSARVGF
jgi:hypothetical protein